MIKLAKLAKPKKLEDNEVQWTAEYQAHLNAHDGQTSQAPRRYANAEIKDVLAKETSSKCAYCESFIEHVSFPHVEHILAKKHHQALVCDWDNLTLACEVCNNAKSDYDSVECPLLNPYRDEVSAHLEFHGPLVVHASPDRGMVTIRTITLNRTALIYRRIEVVNQARKTIDLIEGTENEAVRGVLLEELRNMIAPGSQFSATVNSYLNQSEAAARILSVSP